MQWKELFKFDTTRAIWFFLSLPLGALISSLIFMVLNQVLEFMLPLWCLVLVFFITSYLVGFVFDSLHFSINSAPVRTIFYVVKALIMFISILFMVVLMYGYIVTSFFS